MWLTGWVKWEASLNKDQVSLVITSPPEAEWTKNVFWMYGIVVDETAYGMNWDALRQALADNGVEALTYFVPMCVRPRWYGRFVRICRIDMMYKEIARTKFVQRDFFIRCNLIC